MKYEVRPVAQSGEGARATHNVRVPVPEVAEAPRVLTPDEVALYLKYREMLMPAARLANYDEFLKWLFTAAATVGTLGAAFSNAAFAKLSGVGALAYAAAVALVGAALGLATFARSLDIPLDYWASLDQMLEKLRPIVKRKRWLARAGGMLLGLALLLASLAPLLSGVRVRAPYSASATYKFGKDGLQVALAVKSATAGSTIEGQVLALNGAEKVLAAGRAIADAAGNATLDLTTGALPAEAKQLKLTWVRDENGKPVKDDLLLAIRPGSALSKSAIQAAMPGVASLRRQTQSPQTGETTNCPVGPHRDETLTPRIARACSESKGRPVTIQCQRSHWVQYPCVRQGS